MKIQDRSIEDINKEMEQIRKEVESKCGWLYKNRRYKALSNEKQIRSGYITDKNLLRKVSERN